MNELLTTQQMGAADRLAITSGVSGLTLMENAGRSVADAAQKMASTGATIAVLCGPGNNGGDGFVAARLLSERGFDVRLGLLGVSSALKGDAATMAAQWQGDVLALDAGLIEDTDLIIDALFGAGLTRSVEGIAADVIKTANKRRQLGGLKILSVDVPTGLDGDTGAPLGNVCMFADRTVTFFRCKPAHLLLPGRVLCGHTDVVDIGIPVCVLDQIGPRTYANTPSLWRRAYPSAGQRAHKYSRGSALVLSGPVHATGAARLAARGALRIGAGVVSVASPPDAVAVNAAHLTAIMVKPFKSIDGFGWLLKDRRVKGLLIGPGCGVGTRTQDLVLKALGSSASVVLDADALTSFMAGFPAHSLFSAITDKGCGAVVLTPHEGEFTKLFGKFAPEVSKLERARQAAQRSGAIVVLKGPDTVIAAPDGHGVINDNAPAWLATAGSGDVLAGMITGLMAQGMTGFAAACAGVWLHGACAAQFGEGLIAEDLPELLPQVLGGLRQKWSQDDGDEGSSSLS